MSDFAKFLDALRARTRKKLNQLRIKRGSELSVTSIDVVQSVGKRMLRYDELWAPEANAASRSAMAHRILENWFRDRYDKDKNHGSVTFDQNDVDRKHHAPGPDAQDLVRELHDFANGQGPLASRVGDPETRKRMVQILWAHVVEDESERDIALDLGISRRQVHKELTFMISMLRSAMLETEDLPSVKEKSSEETAA